MPSPIDTFIPKGLEIDAGLAALGEGFCHIVPGGPDHVAFLLGLFFLAREFRPLVWQVTLFTLAHSLSLGLVLLGVVQVSERAIEIVVALSVAVVAAENFLGGRLQRCRLWLVLCFGLVHGSAFAHTFPGVDPTSTTFLPALFGFNLGVELAQLCVVGAAFIVFGPYWDRPWYRRRVMLPASLVLTLSGLTWAVCRAMTG